MMSISFDANKEWRVYEMEEITSLSPIRCELKDGSTLDRFMSLRKDTK